MGGEREGKDLEGMVYRFRMCLLHLKPLEEAEEKQAYELLFGENQNRSYMRGNVHSSPSIY